MVLRILKEGDHLRSCHRRKPFEEVIDRRPLFQVIEKGLERHSGPGEDRGSAENVLAAGDRGGLHGFRLLLKAASVQGLPSASEPSSSELHEGPGRCADPSGFTTGSIQLPHGEDPAHLGERPGPGARRSLGRKPRPEHRCTPEPWDCEQLP